MTFEHQGLTVLGKSDIMRLAPSVYATGPKSDVSDRYAFIPTFEIGKMLLDMGWYPVQAMEQRSNKAENEGYNRHLVRFGSPDFIDEKRRYELCLLGSHNRTSGFLFDGGAFEFTCANGLIIKSEDFGSIRVRHSGNIQDQVYAAVKEIAANIPLMADRVSRMETIELTHIQQDAFADAVAGYVYGDEVAERDVHVHDLLRPKRWHDRSDSDYSRPKENVWKTFNVVQENIIRGGVRKRGANNRFRKSKRITSVDKNVKLNRALWEFAEVLADNAA